jgi:riboflavin synthase
MFTGLIRHLGTLDSRSPRSGGTRLRIAAPQSVLDRAEVGASIAVNGACLTSVLRDDRAWETELSEETLAKTTLGRLVIGATLHLEPSLRVGDPLDGHLVSGHVDGLGALLERPSGEGLWRFSMPAFFASMTAPKGSIALDGISLTVVDCSRDWFTVALIPETVKRTALATMKPGDAVNLEADPIGRYVARALEMRDVDKKLAGFVKHGFEGN